MSAFAQIRRDSGRLLAGRWGARQPAVEGPQNPTRTAFGGEFHRVEAVVLSSPGLLQGGVGPADVHGGDVHDGADRWLRRRQRGCAGLEGGGGGGRACNQEVVVIAARTLCYQTELCFVCSNTSRLPRDSQALPPGHRAGAQPLDETPARRNGNARRSAHSPPLPPPPTLPSAPSTAAAAAAGIKLSRPPGGGSATVSSPVVLCPAAVCAAPGRPTKLNTAVLQKGIEKGKSNGVRLLREGREEGGGGGAGAGAGA